MSQITEVQKNYVRMSMLLRTLTPKAVRAVFDKEFPPTSLPSVLKKNYNILFSLQKSRVINQVQWNLLFPTQLAAVDSKTFDVTLMICLIRHLTSVTPPSTGFDRLPSAGETTIGADLARIKYYRNRLAHSDDNTKINFNTEWSEISNVIRRLGGQAMYQECQELKNITLDTSIIPWNIMEQMTTQLENWKEDDHMFVETRAASNVLQCIKVNSCVTVTGSSGVGKTFTVRHVALQMEADGYAILPVTNPEDIVNYYNPKKKTLYVIDDLCGTYTLNQTYLDKWKAMLKDIGGLLVNRSTKIIASCRLQVCQDEQFKLLPLFKAFECNLLLPNMSLTKEEKQLIAEKYLKSDASKISQYINLYDCLPLLCKLYNEHQALNVVDFFKNPFSVYEKEIDTLKYEKAYGKYCALALCVMFNNRLKEEWLTDDVNQKIKQIIENTCEYCRLNRGTSRLVLKDEMDTLIYTFLTKEKGCYRTIHDKLFDFLTFYFGNTKMITLMIKNGHVQLISERLVFKKQADSDRFTITVPDELQQLYIERMVDDWSNGDVFGVFTNNNMKSPEFRNAFLTHLKRLDITYRKQLAIKHDYKAVLPQGDDFQANFKQLLILWSRPNNTPMLQCCDLGDINMIEWCCSNGADVNDSIPGSKSPLHIACEKGYTDIVTKLIHNKADVNKFTLPSKSPLYIACKSGYTDIVTKLVDNKADINSRTLKGKSSLYIACKRGYADIVNKLVDNKAHINTCTDDKIPPESKLLRHVWSKKHHGNKANIKKSTDGKSPLHIACQKGYADIVKKLVDNKANVNKCIDGESPLHTACKGGYADIVIKLVDNKADINMCTSMRESPLYIACKGGFTDIVTKLMDNKADINTCTYFGESPLHIACKQGFIKIVKILITKGSSYTVCDKKGRSPLDIARLSRQYHIVEFIEFIDSIIIRHYSV